MFAHVSVSAKPDTVAQSARALKIDRANVYRILRAIYGPDFRNSWNKAGRSYNDNPAVDLPTDTSERFYAALDKSDGHGPHGDCWIWTEGLDQSGYGRGLNINGRIVRATHIALALDGRPRPNAHLIALHSCDNRQCVNPNHLRWGTDAENQEDVRQRGKRGPRWLPDEVVHMIHQSDEPPLAIANRLGVSPSCVSNIRAGRTHKHIFDQYRHIMRGRNVA